MRGAGGEEVRIERGGRRGCLWCEDKSVWNVMECQESSLDPFMECQESSLDPFTSVHSVRVILSFSPLRSITWDPDGSGSSKRFCTSRYSAH